MIRDAAQAGHIVIACGGGGIPVAKNERDDYAGVEAVVDKDWTSSILAAEIGADLLIILTDVPKVYLNFRKPEQQALSALTVGETERYLLDGHFGSRLDAAEGRGDPGFSRRPAVGAA